MKAIIVLLAVATLTGCQKQAESTQAAGSGFNVEKLFTVGGCSVYRFRDGMRPIYYTNCKGSTQTQQSCGKNCSYTQSVSGGAQ